MQTTPRAPLIDPTDTNILLTHVLDTEQKFSDAIMQKSFVDEKREIVYLRPMAWLIWNGYIPKDSEWILNNGKRILDMYICTCLQDIWREMECHGMPHFPKDLDYSNIYGQDLEHDVEAWQNTTAFLGMKDHHRMKAMELICQEIGLYYDLSSVSSADKGPMAQLIRIQEMYKAAQRRVIAAGQQLEEALGMVTRAFPRNADEIRHQESLMRKFIILEERSKYAQPDDRDSYWADRFMKNLLRSGGADDFANEGTRFTPSSDFSRCSNTARRDRRYPLLKSGTLSAPPTSRLMGEKVRTSLGCCKAL